MILFLDTEFTDFHQPELISIGLVSECGRHEFYAECSELDLTRCSDFVRSAVLPRLGRTGPLPGLLDRTALGVELQKCLEKVHALDGGRTISVLYDFDTDFDLFRQALEVPLPTWLEGANVADEVNAISWARNGLEESQDAHHALHDARELRLDWLEAKAKGQ